MSRKLSLSSGKLRHGLPSWSKFPSSYIIYKSFKGRLSRYLLSLSIFLPYHNFDSQRKNLWNYLLSLSIFSTFWGANSFKGRAFQNTSPTHQNWYITRFRHNTLTLFLWAARYGFTHSSGSLTACLLWCTRRNNIVTYTKGFVAMKEINQKRRWCSFKSSLYFVPQKAWKSGVLSRWWWKGCGENECGLYCVERRVGRLGIVRCEFLFKNWAW